MHHHQPYPSYLYCMYHRWGLMVTERFLPHDDDDDDDDDEGASIHILEITLAEI